MLRSIIILIIAFTAIEISAQRRISPVETPATQTQAVNLNPRDTTNAKDPQKMPNLIHFHDKNGKLIYVDTITGKEFHDSTAIKKETTFKYPLWDEISIGFNFLEPMMRCLGQDYGIADMWAELSIHNRFKPVIEFGLGEASHSTDDSNYSYKSSISPYFKIGLNYNFLYNKTNEYQFYGGIRYGFSSFSFEVNDVKIDNSYWNEYFYTNIPSQNSSVGYAELLLGLKVKIYKQWALGWALKYHTIINETKCKYGKPWYIPGFGSRDSSLSAAFSVIYSIPLHNNNKKTHQENQ